MLFRSDEEVLASAGLALVDAPSSSSGESEEERLLRKLLSLYRARQAKLVSREALVAKAGVDIEKRAEELRVFRQEALRALAEEREQVDEERKAFLLEKAEIEERHRLVAEKLSAQGGELAQRKVNLDSHEEELAAREQTFGGSLKEAKDAAAAAEAAKAAGVEAGEGSGDRTDGPEAAGAPGATPTADPSAAAAEPGSERASARCLLEGRRRHLHEASLGIKL